MKTNINGLSAEAIGASSLYNILMQAPVVFSVTKGENHVLYLVNDAAYKLWGKGPDMIGKPLLEALPELNDQEIKELFDHVYNTGETYSSKAVPITSFATGKAERFYFDIVYQPYYEVGNDTPAGVVSISYDVTFMVQSQQNVEESEERFRTMANSIPQLAWMTDAQGWIYWYNDRWYDYTGTSPEEMVGWGWKKVHHPDMVDRVVERFAEAIETGQPWEDTFPLRSKNGDYRWFLSRSIPVRKKDGSLLGWFGTNTDITEEREIKEALQQSEANLRNLVLHAPVAMAIGSAPDFVVEVANTRMLEIWEKQADEIIGRPVFEVLPEAGEQGLRQVIQRVYATGEPFTANEMPVSLPRNNKLETVFLNFIYEPIKNADGTVSKIVAVATDVTELVLARKKVEESHKEAQFVMDTVPQIIWLALPDGYHYYYNKQWTNYTGLSFTDTQGEGWNDVFHPDDQERAWEKWSHSLETGEPYEIEYRLRRYDGEYPSFLGRAVPIRDEAGIIVKWFGTGTEIDDQKTFERTLEQRVKESTKELRQSNSELQQFIHMASHDLKEPVRKITVFISQLQAHLKEQLDEKSKFYLGRVQSATTRMFSIIHGVLNYSVVAAKEEAYELVNLNKVVKDVKDDLELRIQDKAATINHTNLPELKGAQVMLHQVFYNLISNSLKFSRADAAPVINISSEIVSRDNKVCARILVKDNGIGFEQKYAEKIFGSFTRLHTKDEYEGAGLGLSLCKTIIERHEGSIKATSAEGEGTEFEIMLPMKS
ncbi:PAS domain-containing sensor histidine kinase [Polluticoccus soli]|uniref:PAS domain-containing sensor histidine kinase n=1 Tax=Polluticoccus soli TaxID=3034150 RepID=UPI0023E1A091|nr:PAS domain-containing sensor histidine kinase [Flavipsychrobacter sp. JY13-12]